MELIYHVSYFLLYKMGDQYIYTGIIGFQESLERI